MRPVLRSPSRMPFSTIESGLSPDSKRAIQARARAVRDESSSTPSRPQRQAMPSDQERAIRDLLKANRNRLASMSRVASKESLLSPSKESLLLSDARSGPSSSVGESSRASSPARSPSRATATEYTRRYGVWQPVEDTSLTSGWLGFRPPFLSRHEAPNDNPWERPLVGWGHLTRQVEGYDHREGLPPRPEEALRTAHRAKYMAHSPKGQSSGSVGAKLVDPALALAPSEVQDQPLFGCL